VFGSPNENPKGVSALAWEKFVRSFMLPGRANLTAKSFLQKMGLPAPWPGIVDKVVAISDELDIVTACYPATPITHQWNGTFGAWPYNTAWFTPDFLPHGSSFDASRLISGLMERRATALYKVVHETAHVMLYEIALRGLFRESIAVNAEKLNPSLHLFGEMFAEYVSHYELGVDSYEYWQKHWKPISESSEGQSANVGRAAYEAGLRDPKARAILIYAAYYNPDENPMFITSKKCVSSVELTSVWMTQRSYAKKSLAVVKNWWANYWSDPSIKEFISDFIPSGPAPVWLTGLKAPLEIRTLDDLGPRVHDLFYRWAAPPKKFASHLRARRKVQRSALAVCQLYRLTEYNDLRVSDEVRRNIRSLIDQAREDLARNYRYLEANGMGGRSELDYRRAYKAAEEVVGNLSRSLQSATKSRGVTTIHPGVHGKDMSDGFHWFNISKLKELSWPPEESDQVRVLTEMEKILNRLSEDMGSILQAEISDKSTVGTIISAAGFARESYLIRSSGLLPSGENLVARVRGWAEKALSNGEFQLGYRWSWIEEMPYIDPLIGYRVT
jgi:hypothetical protein